MNTTTENLSDRVMGWEDMDVVEFGDVSGETKGNFSGNTLDGGAGFRLP